MRRSFIKFIAIVLIICEIMALAGCGTTSSPSTQNNNEIANNNSSNNTIDQVDETQSDYANDVDYEDTKLEDELAELIAMETSDLTMPQRNAINMLNYMTVLVRDIYKSKNNRMYLDSTYNDIINNTYPNAVDTQTGYQIDKILDTLEQYKMVDVKRERLEYLYEQNQAQALRAAIPNPLGLLSAVQSGDVLRLAASVIYMAVDSVSSYEAASTQADFQYLKDGWELDDAEKEIVHNSRKEAFQYLLQMVNDNDIPGELALNEDAVDSFVEWKGKTEEPTRQIQWFENNVGTYRAFGPYWLELAGLYYNGAEYQKCLSSIERYKSVSTQIFRYDKDFAKALPMAIVSAKGTMSVDKYVEYAKNGVQLIIDNTDDKSGKDWALKYFVAETCLDLYSITKDRNYLDEAYNIALNNVNVLLDDQKKLNSVYLSDVEKIEKSKSMTKKQKAEITSYNNMITEKRKTELPPVNEALYYNCDLLFAIAKEKGLSEDEKKQINNILHEDGKPVFLTAALEEMFDLYNDSTEFDVNTLDIQFDGKQITIPASCITDRPQIKATISGITIDDWSVNKVERPKKYDPNTFDCSSFTVNISSESLKKQKYEVGDKVEFTIIPVVESPDKTISISFEAVTEKKLGKDGIAFDRK